MTVICKIQPCPFRNSSGFCRNKLLSIDEQGRCKHLYQNVYDWREPIGKEYMDGDWKENGTEEKSEN